MISQCHGKEEFDPTYKYESMVRSNKSRSKNEFDSFLRLRLPHPAKIAGVILEQPRPKRENAKLSQLCICTKVHAGYFPAWLSTSWPSVSGVKHSAETRAQQTVFLEVVVDKMNNCPVVGRKDLPPYCTNPLTVQTLLLYSPVGLDLKLVENAWKTP